MEKQDIRNYTLEELKKEMVSMGEPVHRAVQIFKWLNQKSVSEFKSMTDLPRLLCNRLDKAFIIGELKVEDHKKSKDGAEKFLWRLRDGKFVESVLIRDNERMTLCLSTQVGCKYRCLFCASGKMNFVRDLEAGEIVGQILQVWRIYGMKPSNIVFMGMGEPFDNYDNLVKALKIINDKDGLGIGARKMTVSTCGIVPGILKLKDIGL
ncbi:MAG: radical SAM protein, partial [Candidatus Omnitrophica bacterium]|nr:radical SAM protein [Candidatus Omnitrophota bacterium]